jgi:hypothetical protein
MTSTEIATAFSFLTSGPKFVLQLAQDFESLPDLSSPVSNGRGGRSFDFVPSERDGGLSADEGTLIGTLTAGDGRAVELYERPERPLLWWLRWPLANGAIYTHLRKEDGLSFSDVTVASVSVVEDQSGGTPFVLLDPPLGFGASTSPGFQERAIWFSSARSTPWSVTLQRPGFVPSGKRYVASGDFVSFQAGTAFGIDVQVTGSERVESQDLLDTVLASLTEG